jgi:hypothetical protein
MLAAAKGETKAAPISTQPAASKPAPPRQISEDTGQPSRYDMKGMSFKDLIAAARQQTSSSSGPFQGQQAPAAEETVAEPEPAAAETVAEPEPAAVADEASEATESAPAGSSALPTDTAEIVAFLRG